ncbi:MAG TPA: nuclear transport factor 2 family protein [Candidatus Methylomirabilis sp.]|nr:nuclear transport factor 2 family protein [Candidatus Methylomirabilis sp.]
MGFDAQAFLDRYALAYNDRDPEGMRLFFDLSDPRFAVFEDFTGDLIDGEAYSAMLEAAFDATGRMSFELLRCDDFGGVAVLHAIQRVVLEDVEEGMGEARIRATLWIKTDGDGPRVVSAHFSAVPSALEECGMGGCGCAGHPGEE